MLRITMSKSASGAKKYYCEAYYKEGHSAQVAYYAEQDEMIGRWGGKSAAMLGLAGDIRREDFAKLCDNINPNTGKTFTGRNDTDRTVGYDFTFNASKSVSLAYAFGNTDEKKNILDAFHASVQETMTEIETGMQTRVRAKRKNENRMTGNIAYGAFTHFTTRPIDGVADPHLHSHCFVFNGTFDEQEQKWKAGQFQQVKQDAPYYEAFFHATLAEKLQQAGYKVTRTKHGFELAGIDKTTLEKFSRRTQEIEEYNHEHNITGEAQKAQSGARTREAKRPTLSHDEQEQQWHARLTAQEKTALGALKAHATTSGTQAQRSDAAQEAVRFSLVHHLERKSVSSDKEILATAIQSRIGDTSPQQVRKAFADDDTILATSKQLRTFITTKDALREEKQLIQRCIETRNSFRPIDANYAPQNPLLNDQQQAAVRHVFTSTDGVIIVTGKAGTGKTTLMKEVQQGILASGKKILAFAPSSEASRNVQRSEGFDEAETVARLILDKALQDATKHQVIWVDEAGMLSNKDMNHILTIAKTNGARVILSGDTMQHTSVERGDALRIIQQQTGIAPATVNKIQRQQQVDYKDAVQSIASGAIDKGMHKLDRLGAIHEIGDSDERIKAVARDYYQSAYPYDTAQPKNVLVIAPTHAEGDAVTAQIRHKLQEQHKIGRQEQPCTVLRNRQLTEAQKQLPDSYHPGDILAFHRHGKGIKAGTKLEVLSADATGLTVKNTQDQPFQIALSEAKKFNVFAPQQIGVAEGDKIRITANGKGLDGRSLFNGSTFQVDGFDKDGNLELSNGSKIASDFGHFNYGYVLTSHASQGKTADKVILSQSSATLRASSMEQFYVSVSRGRQGVSIYTDDKAELQQAVSQSSQRFSATELMGHQQEQEINRISLFRQWQEKATATYHQLKSRYRHDGLSPAARTEPEQAREH